MLCPVCEAKAKKGQITEADIEVSRALVQLAGRSRELDSVTLVKSYRVDRDYLLEVRESGIPALRSPTVKAELERMLGGRLWIAGAASSSRQLIEDLVHPLAVSELSTLWLPDGSRVSRAVIGRAGRMMDRKLSAVQKLVKVARGIDLLVDYEAPMHSQGRRVQSLGSWTSAYVYLARLSLFARQSNGEKKAGATTGTGALVGVAG